jgi:hypothetical protein
MSQSKIRTELRFRTAIQSFVNEIFTPQQMNTIDKLKRENNSMEAFINAYSKESSLPRYKFNDWEKMMIQVYFFE